MNWIALIVAAVVAMIIGHLRYGPLFGKQWMKLTGMTESDMKKDGMMQVMIVALLNSFVMMYVLHYMITNLSDGTMMGAMMGAFWIWLGFLLTQQVSATLWSKKPSVELVVLNALYRLVVVMAAAVIFTMM